MGACNFFITARGSSISEAYQSAVDNATADHGWDSYNGTISTTNGVKDKTSMLKSLLEQRQDRNEAIHEWEALAMDNAEKWGACWGAHLKEDLYIFAGCAAE